MDQAEQLRNVVIKMNPIPRPLSRVITVTSGKGGVGKSNTSINLACQFKKLGKRVIILDADFGLANIEIIIIKQDSECFGNISTWGLGEQNSESRKTEKTNQENISHRHFLLMFGHFTQRQYYLIFFFPPTDIFGT